MFARVRGTQCVRAWSAAPDPTTGDKENFSDDGEGWSASPTCQLDPVCVWGSLLGRLLR
jgi:hypothetical protein